MQLYETLKELSNVKYNHKMIVHGIYGERQVIALPVTSFVCMLANGRDYFTAARHSCKFPIKDVNVNRYNKRLTDEQYSALITLLIHCKDYSTPGFSTDVSVEYKSSKELRYCDELKAFIDGNVEFAENLYNLGFDTGDIHLVHGARHIHRDIMEFFTDAIVSTVPDEYFADEATEDVEIIGPEEDE